jgi:hypothetical protein
MPFDAQDFPCLESQPLSNLDCHGQPMPSFIAHLTKTQQRELLRNLNYLNTAEIKSFCKKHSLPYTIVCETRDGRRKSTSESDRKGILINRIRHFLKTGVVLKETCFPFSVVCHDPVSKDLSPTHRLFYGQYDKTNRSLLLLMKELTNGQFQDGAIARILARDFWSSGHAPTVKEFASAWLSARQSHTRPKPEWAFLSDRSSNQNLRNWKQLRLSKSRKVRAELNKIEPADT